MESMGLAAPRRKTKYDIDPRNNAWANDDNKFGQKLMEKFGWAKGKGLGAQEDGETENIKVKVKNDKQGIGANNDYSDTWLDHQDDFNSILAALNTSHSAPGSGTATPTNEETVDAVSDSMEERSKTSKSRVHYKKFTQGKDLTRANASDLDALFGRRKKFEKRSRKVKMASKSEPASPFSGMTPLGTTPTSGNSPRKEDDVATAGDVKTEADDGSQDKEYDAAGNLRTVTSTMSVSDYFAKKMAEIKAKRSGAVSAAVDQFCEYTKMKAEEAKAMEILEEKTIIVKEEKPEVFAQEKFQPASLSVQQYFEQKMKEKKARQEEAAKADAVNNNDQPVDEALSVEQIKIEPVPEPAKKKKKKKKTLVAEASVSPAAAEDKPKKKKKKLKESNQAEAAINKEVEKMTEPGPTVVKEEKSEDVLQQTEVTEKKKKKKRKLVDDIQPSQEGQQTQVLESEVPKKKKKKKIKEDVPQETIVTAAIELPIVTESKDKKKEKKKKKEKTGLKENL